MDILNQVCASLWPVHDWFFETAFIHDIGMHVCVCMCVSAPESIYVNGPCMTS